MLLQSAPPGPPAIQSPKNGRFQDPTPELLHQNLWVGGHLEICPEASFGGTNPFIWEKPLEQNLHDKYPSWFSFRWNVLGGREGWEQARLLHGTGKSVDREPGLLCPSALLRAI